ncbi:hypothetical protein DB31_8059 [Hyalangium minutum]|uniref:Uncharacterized protein n=1 Tax=Hyalangium minutum TaxID=394096 RepID=A0A085WIR3_9BACT|nr:hypothetical protein DB31_8059 [Hyalangium minutum]
MRGVRWMWLCLLPLVALGGTGETPRTEQKPQPVKFNYL